MTNASKLQHALNHCKAAGLGLCLLTAAGTANAAFIDLTGTVTSGGSSSATPVAPFSSGDELNGFIEINDSAATAGSTFGSDDLLDFNVTVGGATFALTTAAPFGFFGGSIGDDGSGVLGLNINTNTSDFRGCGATCNLTLNGDADSFLVSQLEFANFGFAQGSDLNATVRQQAAAVPEPASVLLFGAGLLGLGLTRYRKR